MFGLHFVSYCSNQLAPVPPSPRWLSSTILVPLSVIAAAALAGYLSLTPRRRSPWVNIRVKGIFFTPRVDAAVGFLSGKNPSHPSCFPSYQ